MASDAYIHKHLPGEPGGALLFAFHGTGGDEQQLLEMAHRVMPSATIVSPRGDVSEHGSARFFRRTAEGVYDMDDLARASAKMAGFVSAHIEAAKPSAVFGIGYSNGANILASTMFEAPGLKGRRILITAGRRDPICPPNLTARLESWLRDLGADVIVDWREGGHEVQQGEIAAARTFLRPIGA